MCPAPAPPPACGRLPRLDHSTITLPGSTRLAPDTQHWSHITHHHNQSAAGQCPCSDKAQCVGQPRLRRAAAANQDYYSLAPSAPPPVTRPDNTQQLRRRRQRCTVQCVQCVQYSVYSGDECGEQGMEECPVAAPPAPAPAHHLGCAARDQQC